MERGGERAPSGGATCFKVGILMVVLGVMHLLNLYVLSRYRRAIRQPSRPWTASRRMSEPNPLATRKV